MTTSVGFIGLGGMGQPMARNLLKAGFALRVFNRSVEKARGLADAGAQVAANAGDTVRSGGVVFTMLANDAAVEEVVLGQNGVAESLGQGGIHVSMSTIAPETSQRLAKAHAQHGSAYVAAPVFGRPEAAAAQKLWICTSGPEAAKQLVRPMLEALGQGIFDFGDDPGSANVVKLCGNFLIAAAIEAIAEATTLGEKNHIDRAALINFFAQTILACPIYQNYGRIIANEAYEPAGFRLALGLKDINLVRDVGESSRTPMPLADLLHERLLSAMAKGREDMDWTAIGLGVSENAGLRRKA
jgi:3-hydroxyisobutyrate dehydrogenase-like beta-hydroxyacid dehydrogenase